MDGWAGRRYGPVMNRNSLRRFAALVAAYGIALQALFGAFAIPGHVALAGADASICLSGPDGGTPTPQRSHDACPMCLAGGCAHLIGAGPRASTLALPPLFAMQMGAPPAHRAIPIRIAHRQPNAPRAPPAG
jgi:hypothetical protein